MISIIYTSVFLLCRLILDLDDADGGELDASADEGGPEEVDVIDNSRGLVVFVSDHARERLLMSSEWQQDGTFKTMKTKFFRQV